jgi:hypothetical protein
MNAPRVRSSRLISNRDKKSSANFDSQARSAIPDIKRKSFQGYRRLAPRPAIGTAVCSLALPAPLVETAMIRIELLDFCLQALVSVPLTAK